MAEFDAALLARVEDAGINASAPPQQLWQDGWLLRMSPGKAKRARCVNAVAEGRLPLDDKLQRAVQVMRGAGLPLIVRITPFSQPDDLDAQLATRGYTLLDDTRVMVLPSLATAAFDRTLPPSHGTIYRPLAPDAFAATVGALRGSSRAQQAAHAERLRWTPVPYRGYAVVRQGGGVGEGEREGEGEGEGEDGKDNESAVLACAQFAQEGDLVGLYDVFTRPSERGRGLAGLLCRHLLAMAAGAGATVAYLQVERDNQPARAIYARLGFIDAYGYHYRQAPD